MDEYIKKLIEENLVLTKEIKEMTKKMSRYMLWAQIFGFLKLLIILVPIVLAIFYLPPLLKDIFAQYQGLLGFDGGNLIGNLLGGSMDGLDLNNINVK